MAHHARIRIFTAALATALALAGCVSITPGHDTFGFPVSRDRYEGNTWTDVELWLWSWEAEPEGWSSSALGTNMVATLVLLPVSLLWLSVANSIADEAVSNEKPSTADSR